MLQNFRLSLQIKKHPPKTRKHDLGKRMKQIIPTQVDNDHIVFAIWKKSKRKKAA